MSRRRFRGDPLRRWAYSREEDVKPWPMWLRLLVISGALLLAFKALGVI